MLPTMLPVFPLPDVVLFPNVFLPLHIFEPRYRDMVRDALEDDRLIGMTLLRAGWKDDYEGPPPVYQVGCAGLITHVERLPDGRYNIVLRGLTKFRILDEDQSRSYRVARVEFVPESLDEAGRADLRAERRRLESLLVASGENGEQPLPPNMPDDELVNALAQYLELEPVERQALLERSGLIERCRSLSELLEMKVLSARGWNESGLH
jgi:uncharacterized protein